MARLRNFYNSTVGSTGMQPRVFVSFCLVTVLLMAMLVACSGSSDPTATASANLVNTTPTTAAAAPAASSAPSTASSAAPSAAPSASSSTAPVLPIGSAKPSAAPSTSTTTSTGAVAATDGGCPATHPVKAGQVGPIKSYTVSGSTSYDTMRATECFATEADAQAAGYRKSAR